MSSFNQEQICQTTAKFNFTLGDDLLKENRTTPGISGHVHFSTVIVTSSYE